MRKPLRVLAHSLLLLIIPRITPYILSRFPYSQQIIDGELHLYFRKFQFIYNALCHTFAAHALARRLVRCTRTPLVDRDVSRAPATWLSDVRRPSDSEARAREVHSA